MKRTASALLSVSLVTITVAGYLRPAAGQRDVELDDLIFESQHNPDAPMPGCNSASLLSLHGGQPLLQVPDPGAALVDAFAATTDFRHVFVLAGFGNPAGTGYAPELLHLVRSGDGWSDWTIAAPVTGARLTYDRSFTILPDDETLLVEEFGTAANWDLGSVVGKYCLSEIGPDGALGPRRGTYVPDPARREKTPRQLIASADGRHAFLVPDHGGYLVTLDAVTMQPASPPFLMVRHSAEGSPYNEFFGSISPDERYIVTRRLGDDALGVGDLIEGKSWLLPMGGRCGLNEPCGEVAFNYGPENHGLLAVHGQDQLLIFEFVPHGPLRQMGRLPLNRITNTETTWSDRPLAWSGSGQYIVVGTARPNGDELLVVKVDDGGRTLSEYRVLTGCPGSLGVNSARVIFTANRRLAHVASPVPCVPPTATPTVTPTPTETPPPPPTSTASRTADPTRTPERTHTSTPTSTAVPTWTATPRPRPVYLPLLLRETCTPMQRHIDAALVLDVSSSMLQPTTRGRTKLASAQDAARAFLDAIHLDIGDQAALVAFNVNAWLIAPLTTERTTLDAGIAGLSTASFTRIDRGIAVAREELTSTRRRANNVPVMIVLTDGRNNPVPVEVAVGEARIAQAAGIQLFTIGLGSDLDADALQQMASRAEWFYTAPDAEQLADIYRAIAVTIPCAPVSFWGRR